MKKYILCFLACILGMEHAWSSNGLIVSDVTLPLSGTATIDIGCSFDIQELIGTTYLGYQLDLVLGDGLELVENNGKVVCENGFTGTDHSIKSLKKENNTYRFVVVSMNEESLPMHGSLLKMYVKVKTGASVQGQVNAKVTSAKFTTADFIEESIADVDFRINVVGDKASQSVSLSALPAMTYGDAAYTLPQKTTEGLMLTWSVNNAAVASVSGNKLTIIGAGSATVTATQTGNDDYLPFSREFTLTVNKATLTVTADNKTKQEGEVNPELTVTYSGFVNGDNASSLTTQPTVTTTATKDSPVGTYPITASGASSVNYTFNYVNGTLTVTEKPAQPTIEVTDISLLDDAIYIEPLEGRIGDDVIIEVRLKNAEAVTSYGFELVLPMDMSIDVTTDGDFDDEVTLSTRHNKHTVTTNLQSDGSYKVAVASMSSKTLTGNDGVVLTIVAHIADNMAVGDYPIMVKNPLVVYGDATKPAVQPTQTIITIEDYIKGDVDSDGVIDLADAVLVINHYVGKPVTVFNAKAADVDGDGVIDLADAVLIINYYVGKIPSLSRSIDEEELEAQ